MMIPYFKFIPILQVLSIVGIKSMRFSSTWNIGRLKQESLRRSCYFLNSKYALHQSSPHQGECTASVPKKFIPIPYQYHEQVDLLIDDLTNTGLGVGRKMINGSNWVIMVPLVLPGEVVRVRIFKNEKNYSEADLVEVLTPSENRVTPKCEYFSQCGGCQYQHMDLFAQRQWKMSQVKSLLEKIGGVSDVEVNNIIGTDQEYFYRSKLTPHYDAPREMKKVKVGFQRRGSRNIVDIEQCIIATPSINAQYKETRTKLIANLDSSTEKPPKNGATLLFRDCNEGVETDNRKIISQTVGDIVFKFKAGEFFQNNAYVLPLMVKHVIDEAIGEGCNYLIDAYCGSGLFSLCASKSFKQVFGVEVSELAVKAAIANAEANGITNAQFSCGTSEAIFSKVKHLPSDETTIILDPPRKGCDESFLRQLCDFRPKKIVYVSCDPATQARDAKFIIANGFAITNVTPIDLFPQTRHCENVITFQRAS